MPTIAITSSWPPVMLKPVVFISSIFAFLMVFHFAVNKETLPAVQLDYSSGWKVRRPWEKVEDDDYSVQLMASTGNSLQKQEGPKVSADFLREYYSKQAPQRMIQLKSIGGLAGFATLYNVLVPEVYCPDLIRVGNVNDGGKWVCNPKEMPQENCSIYSLGLRNDITFDREIQAFNNNSCKIYGYDAVAQSPQTHQGYHDINGQTYKIQIGPVTAPPNQSTIADLLHSHGENYTEFLKIDIEGAEYVTLPRFLNTSQVCQIFIEMHGKAYQMRDLLVSIARFGYYLFFYEINGDSLQACEYSFIHKNCMDRYGTFMLAPYLKDSGLIP